MKQFVVAALSKTYRYLNPPLKRYPHRDYPALESKHLDNPKLFADRTDLVALLRPGDGGIVAELGVAHGDFSEYLLEELRPRQFVAFDVFTMDGWSPAWNSAKERLNNLTPLEFYRSRFSHRATQVKIEVGLSNVRLSAYANKYFDFIYIDADHSYEGVKQDLEVAREKLKDDGMIVLNDYTMFDHYTYYPYGVVQAVNEFVVMNNWKVCGFALERDMFCDIAIRRTSIE